jgi:futalosine hydrolase
MRILTAAATEMEIAALAGNLRPNMDMLVTGVGMVATALACSRALTIERYDLALNVGVCGSFDRAIVPGTVVHVVTDRIAELGAEDGDTFLTPAELQLPAESEFANPDQPPIEIGVVQSSLGCTVERLLPVKLERFRWMTGRRAAG